MDLRFKDIVRVSTTRGRRSGVELPSSLQENGKFFGFRSKPRPFWAQSATTRSSVAMMHEPFYSENILSLTNIKPITEL